MSEKGKKRATDKVSLPADGGLFGPITSIEQKQRRAAQSFGKMLVRSPKRYDEGFVNWVEWKAKQECGDLYSLVEVALKKRRQQNQKLNESVKVNQEGKKND